MGEGIRIRHHTRRNQLLPVPLLHKPWNTQGRPECGTCRRFFGYETVHPCKTLHLQLDAAGTIIVSADIWADLQRTTNAGGFTVANTVTAPPRQIMRPPTVKQPIDGIDLGGALADPGKRPQYFTTAGTTRTDSKPETLTVSLDEYLTRTGQLGVTPDAAINYLLATLLGLTRKGGNLGNDRVRRAP